MRKESTGRAITKRKRRHATFDDDDFDDPGSDGNTTGGGRLSNGGGTASASAAATGTAPSAARPLRKRKHVEFDDDDMDAMESTPPCTRTHRRVVRRRKPDTVFDEDEMSSASDDDILEEVQGEAEDGLESGTPEGSDAYKIFLHSLLENPEENIIEPSDKGFAALLDDDADDDFNYLMESAVVEDDPLEYYSGRSVHVSAQEISQLVAQNEESLRPRTRRVNSANRNRSIASANASASGIPIAAQTDAAAGSTTRSLLPQLAPITDSLPVSVGPGPLITPQEVNATKDQYAQLVHLVAAVNADSARIIANPPEPVAMSPSSAPTTPPERNVASAKEASATLGKIAEALESRRDASVNFWNMVMPYHAYHGQALRGGDTFTYPSTLTEQPTAPPSFSMFESPGISALKATLAEAKASETDWDKVTPVDFAMKVGAPTAAGTGFLAHPVVNALAPNPTGIQNAHWTLAEDALLLMVLHKHTRDFGDAYRDLLPHRTRTDCSNRCNYLKSRRCADNAIKRFLMNNNAPLSKAEIDKLKAIFKQRGPGAENDTKLWKTIQRDLFPNREVSMLKKLWLVREKRRNYKVKYRKKAKMAEERDRDVVISTQANGLNK